MEPVSAPKKTSATKKPAAKGATPADLDQDLAKKQSGKGKRGSLENPEVYENVPGHVIPILEREFDDFDTEAASFLRGEQTEEQFIGFRLKQGVYGQRQPDVQMVRIKLPFGGVTPEQMEMFADVVEQYAPLGKGHITTRQNIQIHHIPLADMAEVIRKISDAGLSSREGCGNTMRNVTGDPWAGVSEGEPFDVTPYAAAYVRYFVRHPTTQLMPRKVKTAFTATPEDRAITGIHDVGFIPKVKQVDGEEVRGVEVRIGGGTSIMPRVAPTLYEFVELDNGDYLKVTEAALRIFDRQNWLRANRMRARIKVLVDKIGMDAFREMVDEELKGDWVDERDFSIDHLLFLNDEEANAPAVPENSASPNGDRSRVRPLRRGQRQAPAPAGLLDRRRSGSSAATSRPSSSAASPRSCATSAAATPGSRCSRTCCCAGCATRRSTTSTQRLGELGLNDAGADEITDVVSCPGTDSCKLGITSSMGLNRAIEKRIEEMEHHRPAHPPHPHQDVAAAPTAAASTTSPTSASTAPRSRSATTRSPPTSPTSAATTRAARSSSATA